MPPIPTEAHWRESARSARFFLIDAKAAFPLFFFLLHIRVWTFIVSLLAMAFFGLIEHYGFSLSVFLRWLRNVLAGPYKLAIPWWKR
jgi:intracellular multiplication protein IcmT